MKVIWEEGGGVIITPITPLRVSFQWMITKRNKVPGTISGNKCWAGFWDWIPPETSLKFKGSLRDFCTTEIKWSKSELNTENNTEGHFRRLYAPETNIRDGSNRKRVKNVTYANYRNWIVILVSFWCFEQNLRLVISQELVSDLYPNHSRGSS